MARARALFGNDIRRQRRYGIYHAYAFVLERAERNRVALAVTPVAARDDLAAKAASLGLLAVAASALLAVLAEARVAWGFYLPAVSLTALSFLLLGVPIALRFRTVTGSLIGSSGLLVPVILPAGLAFLDPMPRWAMLWPCAAQLRLILAGLGGAAPAPVDTALLFASVAAGTLACGWLALRSLEKEFGRP